MITRLWPLRSSAAFPHSRCVKKKHWGHWGGKWGWQKNDKKGFMKVHDDSILFRFFVQMYSISTLKRKKLNPSHNCRYVAICSPCHDWDNLRADGWWVFPQSNIFAFRKGHRTPGSYCSPANTASLRLRECKDLRPGSLKNRYLKNNN